MRCGSFTVRIFFEGLETLDAIKKVATASRWGHDDVPTNPVVIESVRVLN